MVVKKTSDLCAGLFIYGNNAPVGAYIESVVNDTNILSNAPIAATGAFPFEFTSAVVGTYHERNCILADVKNICDERGDIVQMIFRGESNVTRDSYNSIAQRAQTPKYFFRCYPVEHNPSIRQLEKAGLREASECVAYFAMKDFITYGIDFNDLDMARVTVKLQGNDYEIKEKGMSLQVNDTFGYITLGLFKK
jgi:hypothetical protein